VTSADCDSPAAPSTPCSPTTYALSGRHTPVSAEATAHSLVLTPHTHTHAHSACAQSIWRHAAERELGVPRSLSLPEHYRSWLDLCAHLSTRPLTSSLPLAYAIPRLSLTHTHTHTHTHTRTRTRTRTRTHMQLSSGACSRWKAVLRPQAFALNPCSWRASNTRPRRSRSG
jgi:hypothetical protein